MIVKTAQTINYIEFDNNDQNNITIEANNQLTMQSSKGHYDVGIKIIISGETKKRFLKMVGKNMLLINGIITTDNSNNRNRWFINNLIWRFGDENDDNNFDALTIYVNTLAPWNNGGWNSNNPNPKLEKIYFIPS